jgi:PAS domain S-box-containing protein
MDNLLLENQNLKDLIVKLSGYNFIIVSKDLTIVSSNKLEFEYFPLYNAFFESDEEVESLDGCISKLQPYVENTFRGIFDVTEVNGINLFFIPVDKQEYIIVCSTKVIKKRIKRRISDKEFTAESSFELIFTLDSDGNVLEQQGVNDQLISEVIVGKQFVGVFDSDYTELIHQAISRVLNNGKIEHLNLSKDVEGIVFFFKGTLILNHRKELILIIRDDTDRMGKEFELNLKNKAIENSPIGTYVIDYENQYFLYANNAYYDITGFNSSQIIGGEISLFEAPYSELFFVGESQKKMEKIYIDSIKHKTRFEGVFLCKRKNGEEYWNSMVSIPVYDEELNKTIFVGIVQDITERRKSNELLMSAIISTQESERSRFAQDLHDGLGQKLLAAKMNLLAMKGDLLEDSKVGQLHEKSVDLLMNAIHETRNISHSLMSNTLKRYGLTDAINEMIRSFVNLNEITIKVENEVSKERFGLDLEIGVYRIVQELFNNSLKHSNATTIDIRIKMLTDSLLFVKYKDNGIGFNLEKLESNKKTGIGIQNIKSRVVFLGGQFLIETAENKGCSYTLYLPIKRNIDEKKN